jgi:methionine-rich copper-binding protein CopC
MRHVLFTIFFAITVVGSAAPGWAHATLVRSEPAAGTKVSVSPTELRLIFSEMIDVVSAKVTGRGGRAVATGPARAQDSMLVIPLKAPLPPGIYRVDWQVMTTDTHKRGGRFSFEVTR